MRSRTRRKKGLHQKHSYGLRPESGVKGKRFGHVIHVDEVYPFGFIQSENRSNTYFFHFTDLVRGYKPALGDPVIFEALGGSLQGEKIAKNVQSYFYRYEICTRLQESETIELKNFHAYDEKWIQKNIPNYVCAFLNQSGGSIYLGIEDNNKINGTVLDDRQKDAMHGIVGHAVATLKPDVPATSVSTIFHTILDSGSKSPIPDTYVIQIRVEPTDLNIYKTLYGKGDAQCRVGTSNRVLTPHEYKKRMEKIVKRMKHQYLGTHTVRKQRTMFPSLTARRLPFTDKN